MKASFFLNKNNLRVIHLSRYTLDRKYFDMGKRKDKHFMTYSLKRQALDVFSPYSNTTQLGMQKRMQ